MFDRFRMRMLQFMYGRNGVDKLCWALLIAGMVITLLGSILDLWELSILAYLPFGLAVWRMYSRNVTARQRENAWLERMIAPLTDRTHRYFRCPTCRQSVRVPRGKGKISIRCPKCGERFVKKT